MAKAGSPEKTGLGPPYLPALLAMREWGTDGLGLGCYSDIKTVILRCSWTLGSLMLVFSVTLTPSGGGSRVIGEKEEPRFSVQLFCLNV